jgi:osmotically-inducible protein OsmY
MLTPAELSDREIEKNVREELLWEPSVDADAITVTVHNGVATLRGVVNSYFKRTEAEEAALRVVGVQAVANEILVEQSDSGKESDTAIAELVSHTLLWNMGIPLPHLDVVVSNGRVTLKGTVTTWKQREQVGRVVGQLPGVRDINNHIVVKSPDAVPADVSMRIRDALIRRANVDANSVHVRTDGHTVILEGKVRNWTERRDAELSAGSAPGVEHVDNRLVVSP